MFIEHNQTGSTCECGRQRATPDDMARWHRETEIHLPHRNPIRIPPRHATSLVLSPMWAMTMCWTRAGERCLMRRRWASDRWIGEARTVFAWYIEDLEEYLDGDGLAAWGLS